MMLWMMDISVAQKLAPVSRAGRGLEISRNGPSAHAVGDDVVVEGVCGVDGVEHVVS